MSRKHYVLIAQAIGSIARLSPSHASAMLVLVDVLCIQFKADNARFNEAIFRKASGVDRV